MSPSLSLSPLAAAPTSAPLWSAEAEALAPPCPLLPHRLYAGTSVIVARAWGDVRPSQCAGVRGAVRDPVACEIRHRANPASTSKASMLALALQHVASSPNCGSLDQSTPSCSAHRSRRSSHNGCGSGYACSGTCPSCR
jgi:hypothetical protein